MKKSSIVLLVASFIFIFLSFFVRAEGWQLLVHEFTGKKISFLKAVMFSFAFSMLTVRSYRPSTEDASPLEKNLLGYSITLFLLSTFAVYVVLPYVFS